MILFTYKKKLTLQKEKKIEEEIFQLVYIPTSKRITFEYLNTKLYLINIYNLDWGGLSCLHTPQLLPRGFEVNSRLTSSGLEGTQIGDY